MADEGRKIEILEVVREKSNDLELMFEQEWNTEEHSQLDWRNSNIKTICKYWYLLGYGKGRGFTEGEDNAAL